MKNNKNKIIVSLVAIVAFASSFGMAAAQVAPALYISPVGGTKAVGQVFNASVTVTTNTSDIVYAAEGTLGFSNLSCKGISAVDGLMIQSMPTCANPHFLVGIPNGINADKKLFTVSVAGITEGDSALTLTSVDVIGKGVSLGTSATNGYYTIRGSVIVPEKDATVFPVVEINEQGEVVTQGATTTETVGEETPEEVTATTTAQSTTGNLLAAAGEALYGIPSAIVIVLGAFLIALFVGLIYYRRVKGHEKV